MRVCLLVSKLYKKLTLKASHSEYKPSCKLILHKQLGQLLCKHCLFLVDHFLLLCLRLVTILFIPESHLLCELIAEPAS